MPTYEVALSDGRKFRVEADGPPSEADILAQLGQSPTEAPRPPDPRVVAEQDRLDPDGAARRRIYAATPGLQADVERELAQAAEELPWAVGSTVAGAVVPGILAKAAPYAAGAVKAGAGALAKAAPYAAGGAEFFFPRTARVAKQALSAAKVLRGRGPDVAGGMGQAGRAAEDAATGGGSALLDALMRGASYDELAAVAGGTAAPAAKTAATAAGKASTLVDEVAAREALRAPINWRTTDVTPIARPGKGILFGEESTPGLLKLLQDALLTKDAPLVDKIQKAIRQRSHITGKTGG